MSLQIQTGTYTGTGSSFSITGVGFMPKAVFIKGGSFIMQLCLDVMGTDKTQPLTGGTTYYSGGVSSLDTDGFTIGTNAAVNTNATVYYYVALTDPGGVNLQTGMYAGSGVARTITGVGFKPDFVTWSDSIGDTPVFKTSTIPTDGVLRYDLFTNLTARCTSLTNDGFTIATTNEVNGTSRNYYYLAMRNTPNLFKVLTYTGNGTDDRLINGVTFMPDFVAIRDITTAEVTAIRFSGEVGDNAFLADATGEASNIIESFVSDGFQIGTSANTNTSAEIYHAFSFKNGTSIAKKLNNGLRPHPFSPGLAR